MPTTVRSKTLVLPRLQYLVLGALHRQRLLISFLTDQNDSNRTKRYIKLVSKLN